MAEGGKEREREAVGFWRRDYVPDCALPDPRELVDEGWPLEERVRVAEYLRRGEVLASYLGYSSCRFECGLPWTFMGKSDLGDDRYLWPEGLAHYVEHHAVRLPEAFLAHVAERAPGLPPWWRLAHRWRRRRLERRRAAARRDEEREDRRRAREALHDAAAGGDLDEVRRLIDAGADIDAPDSYKLTPLARAASFEIARAFVEAGARIDPQPPGYTTPLVNAVKAGDLAWIDYLLERGAAIDGLDSCNRTPLDQASSLEAARRLLDAGADARLGAPLFWVAHRGEVETLALLLEAGAAVDGAVNAMTPLMAAARSELGDPAIEPLLAAGADANARDSKEQTPLIFACSRNSLFAVDRLLEAGADPRVVTAPDRRVTALHMAALGNRGREGCPEVIERLLAAGAGPLDARDWVGRTPLFIAATYGAAPEVEVLLAAAADPSIADEEGRLPLEIARTREIPDMIALLEDAAPG